MSVKIDDTFIREWHPKYDCTESDEIDYQDLIRRVAQDIGAKGTILKDTFLAIWKWKGAMRVIGQILIEKYETLYAEAFRRAASEMPERRLAALLAPGSKLPGFGGPTGSTIIHFIHPQTMPIIDVRTAQVLFEAGLVSTERTDLEHYEEFRRAIMSICDKCPSWTLREIDRALFAFHKQYLEKNGSRKKSTPTRMLPKLRNILNNSSFSQKGITTNHSRFANAFKGRTGRTLSTPEIVKIMLAESDIQAGSILPNDHGEGNKGQCPCVGTDRQIFDRLGRGNYRVRQYRS